MSARGPGWRGCADGDGLSGADSVRAMLEARSVAVVGASGRPGSFGERLATEALRSPAAPAVHLVNPGYDTVAGRPCLDSLRDIDGPVDLVLLGVGDTLLVDQLRLAADRGDRSAVVFGSAVGLGGELAAVAGDAGMALCGGGCMGFVNPTSGVRALGYLEPPDLPSGRVALVSHSGSAFSALLRSHRQIDFSVAVSSGQELVTTTADYLDYAVELEQTRVVALLLETMREPERLRVSLRRAANRDIPVVLLAVGGSRAGADLVAAHSGALAGGDAAWEALTEAHGLFRVDDLDEMADLLEVLGTGKRVTVHGPGTGIATVHDSGAERVLVADLAERHGVPFAALSDGTITALSALLDPGLVAGNPLDVWGTGADTRALFAACLTTMAADPSVGALALAVDLVPELDGDDSYPLAALDAAAKTRKPLVVLSNMSSAIDQDWAGRLRADGIPVLEGTRSGLRALGHLLQAHHPPLRDEADQVDRVRQQRWLTRLAGGPLDAVDGFDLLADYGIASVATRSVASRDDAAAAAESLGFPVVLKTGEAVPHKSDVGGVVLGLADAAAVQTAYDVMSARLGPHATVSTTAPAGVELALGITRDPLLGPLVVVGAGGILVEMLRDRTVALPPLGQERATRLVDRLRCRPLLDGARGAPRADIAQIVGAVRAIGQLACELGDGLEALDVNPLIAAPGGPLAVDVLVVARRDV